jgi:hypothetical protein
MLEITIVVVVAGLIAMFAFPAVGSTILNLKLDGATQALASDLRRARMNGLRRNASVYVALKDSVTYEIQYVGDRKLPDRVAFLGSSPDTIRFSSFGPTLSGGGTYGLYLADSKASVRVDASGMVGVN